MHKNMDGREKDIITHMHTVHTIFLDKFHMFDGYLLRIVVKLSQKSRDSQVGYAAFHHGGGDYAGPQVMRLHCNDLRFS